MGHLNKDYVPKLDIVFDVCHKSMSCGVCGGA